MLAAMTHKGESEDGFFSIVIQPKHSVERQEVAPRDIVLLLDVSGSMDLYSAFLVQLMYALQHAIGRVETFVFSTSFMTSFLKSYPLLVFILRYL